MHNETNTGGKRASAYWRFAVALSYLRTALKTMRGHDTHLCNICGYEGPFGPGPRGRRPDAKCPRCKSGERHRLLKLWLDRSPERFRNAEVLHFAPEKGMAALLKKMVKSYRTADIEPARADMTLNIESLALPDACFDCVVCSHVLEHVDDRKALVEIRRVLRPGGFAIIMVPIVEGWATTYENPDATTPAERGRHFGQHDHVRYYGADLRDRIHAAGFNLAEFTAEGADVPRYGLLPGEKVFLATRPA
jgi:SAM-dependent methyltransferase